MRKSVKLLIMVAVIAVLAGAYWMISLQNRDSESPEEPEDPLFDVFHVDKTTLTELSWTNEGETYALRLRADAGGWFWEDYEELPLSNEAVATLVTALTDLTSPVRYEVADAAERADKYGLAADGDWITVYDSTNGRQTLYLGKTNDYNGRMYVCTAAAPDTVYMVDPAMRKSTALTPEDMVVEDTLPTVEAERFRGVKLQQGDRTWSLLRTTKTVDGEEKETWSFLRDGAETEAGEQKDAETCAAVLADVVALRYGEARTFRCSERETYGVDEPPVATLTVYYTFTNTTTDSESGEKHSMELQTSYTLYLGNLTEDGEVWARLADKNGIYAVSLPAVLALADD